MFFLYIITNILITSSFQCRPTISAIQHKERREERNEEEGDEQSDREEGQNEEGDREEGEEVQNEEDSSLEGKERLLQIHYRAQRDSMFACSYILIYIVHIQQ